ncbi:MAG: hypothetical protein PHT07_06255 [Paludibacter sp.]|nr:hypothetical protein [Paludibacter sp.]
MRNPITLTIADFNLKLNSETAITLEEGYLPFVTDENTIDPDITIECIPGIPPVSFQWYDLVFEAKNETQKFYSIYRSGTDLGFILYNQQNIDEIQQLAFLDKTFSHWKVYSTPEADGSLIPLRYPLGPIIMYYLTVKSKAVLIHASCIYDGEKGRIFTGFSGNGKSSMSKIWADAGNHVINDDRLIIRKKDDGFFVYNTPMYYSDRPKKAPLHAIHLISHSPDNRIKKQYGALAVSKVMAFCIQNNYNKKFIHNHLDFLSDLCSQIPVYELGFVPDSGIVNFVLSNES